MGSIEQPSPQKKSQITFHVNGKLQIGNLLKDKLSRDPKSKTSPLVKDEYPLSTSLSHYIREVLNLTGY